MSDEDLDDVRHAATSAMWAIKARDQRIREVRARGRSLRQIAEAAGLSHTAIAKICKRGEE